MVDINGCNVQTNDSVKLVGIPIDDKLRFQKHVSVICSRSFRQINAMNRVSNLSVKFVRPNYIMLLFYQTFDIVP